MCDAMLLSSCMICTNAKCGYVYPKSAKEIEIELIQHEYSNKKPQEIDFTAWSFDQMEEYRKLKGYKKGWLYRTLYFLDRLNDYAKETNKKPSWIHIIKKTYAKV